MPRGSAPGRPLEIAGPFGGILSAPRTRSSPYRVPTGGRGRGSGGSCKGHQGLDCKGTSSWQASSTMADRCFGRGDGPVAGICFRGEDDGSLLEFRIQAGSCHLGDCETDDCSVARAFRLSGEERRRSFVYLSDVRGGAGSVCRFDPWRVVSPRHGNCAQGSLFFNKSCIDRPAMHTDENQSLSAHPRLRRGALQMHTDRRKIASTPRRRSATETPNAARAWRASHMVSVDSSQPPGRLLRAYVRTVQYYSAPPCQALGFEISLPWVSTLPGVPG